MPKVHLGRIKITHGGSGRKLKPLITTQDIMKRLKEHERPIKRK